MKNGVFSLRLERLPLNIHDLVTPPPGALLGKVTALQRTRVTRKTSPW